MYTHYHAERSLLFRESIYQPWVINKVCEYKEVLWELLSPHDTSITRYMNWIKLRKFIGWRTNIKNKIRTIIRASSCLKHVTCNVALIYGGVHHSSSGGLREPHLPPVAVGINACSPPHHESPQIQSPVCQDEAGCIPLSPRRGRKLSSVSTRQRNIHI